MAEVFLSLGSNVGNRINYLKAAIRELEQKNISVQKASSVYETEPWGNKGQALFLNCCIECSTTAEPDVLLNIVKDIERELGREKRSVWREREIDIDILIYNDRIINSPGLIVPHPCLSERRFVLTPLVEIDPGRTHPVRKKTFSDLLEALNDSGRVELYERS